MSGIFDRIAGLFGARRDSAPADNPEATTARPSLWIQPAPPPAAAAEPASDADRIIEAICAAVVKTQGQNYTAIKLSGIEIWDTLKSGPEAMQIAVALSAVMPMRQRNAKYSWQVEEARRTIASQLLRKNLPFTGDQLAGPIETWACQTHLQYGMPGLPLLGAAERLLGGAAPEGALRAALERLSVRMTKIIAQLHSNKFDVTTLARVKAILEPGGADARALPPGVFAEALVPWLAALDPAQRDAWRALLANAASAGDKAKPAAKWLAEGQALLAPIGEAGAAAQLLTWMEATTPDPSRPDASLDILKGLIWLASGFTQPGLAGPVSRFAEKCFRKVSGVGARSVKLGNAALWMLSETCEGEAAASELFRLRAKLKLPSVQKLLDDRLATLATKLGSSVADLEDSSLPEFGLAADGTATHPIGDVVATLVLSAADVETRWHGSDGRALKAPSAAIQRDHKAELAAIKQAAKDMDTARAVQALRLEQSWQEDRSWDAAAWRRTFLGHPLRRMVAQALVWRFDGQGAPLDGIPQGDGLLTLAGTVPIPETGTVRLWHPLDSDPDGVLAWRAQIVALGLTQPIKQAHREIYVLTDAERRTGTYSNRFAAHILRQHQFRALCQARGWRFEFLGGWDSWNVPSRALPHHRLTIEYQVEAVDNDQRSAAYVPLHLATDQVRFMDTNGRAVPLESVPPVLFSEMLRDVDLFVAVTSVANDPGWTDGGPEGRFGGYWRDYAFGDLSQNAETRRALIASIAPRLTIADRLEVTGKFLIVQGKRQKYAIHFGSSNIQILPSNRYLCIVPGRAPRETETIKLPFAGDSLLSIILSKAFLLTDESKITDPTILRQL